MCIEYYPGIKHRSNIARSKGLGLNPQSNRLRQYDEESAEGLIAEFHRRLVISGFESIVTSFFALNPGRTVQSAESKRPFLHLVSAAAVRFAVGRRHFLARTAVRVLFRQA